jgi:WD40 repeat protein
MPAPKIEAKQPADDQPRRFPQDLWHKRKNLHKILQDLRIQPQLHRNAEIRRILRSKSTLIQIGSWDNNIYLFNIVYGSKSKPFTAHDNSIIDMVYMPKRKTIVTASWDCSIKTFRYVGNVIDNEDSFFDHENQITALAVNQ